MKADGLDLISGSITSGGDSVNATAWIRLNGQGVVSINDSYNISSVTDLGTGSYSLNFETNMNNINYNAAGCGHGQSGVAFFGGINPSTYSLGSFTFGVSAGGGSFSGVYDSDIVNVTIHGGV